MCRFCDQLEADDRIYKLNCGTATIQLDGTFTLRELDLLVKKMEVLAAKHSQPLESAVAVDSIPPQVENASVSFEVKG